MSVFGTDTQPPFHGHPVEPAYAVTPSPGSYHYGPPVWALGRRGCAAWPTRMRQLNISSKWLDGTGILTCFPFAVLELRYGLGSTNPRLTIVAEEPWPLRRLGFLPNLSATIARIFVPERSTGSHDPASIRTRRLPTGSPLGAPRYRRSA